MVECLHHFESWLWEAAFFAVLNIVGTELSKSGAHLERNRLGYCSRVFITQLGVPHQAGGEQVLCVCASLEVGNSGKIITHK